MAIALRPLTLGELLDRTFQLYRSRFAIFAGIAALAYLPVFVLRALTLWVPKVISPTVGARGLALLLFVVLSWMAAEAANAASIVAVSAAYLERAITISEAYRRASGALPRIFAIVIVRTIGIAFATLALIVPGIILSLMWALAIPVAVLEDAGLNQSLARSRALSAGHRGRIFAIYALYFVLLFALESALAVPVGIVAAVKGPSAAASMAPVVQVADVVIGFVISCLVTPVLSISLSLLYYDERVRKEAFDIHFMMNALDQSTAESAAATA